MMRYLAGRSRERRYGNGAALFPKDIALRSRIGCADFLHCNWVTLQLHAVANQLYHMKIMGYTVNACARCVLYLFVVGAVALECGSLKPLSSAWQALNRIAYAIRPHSEVAVRATLLVKTEPDSVAVQSNCQESKSYENWNSPHIPRAGKDSLQLRQ
jgi:hypothetical protein